MVTADAFADAKKADAERLARLRLARTESIGPVTFRNLIGRFGSGVRALEAAPDLARRGGRAEGLRIPSEAAAKAELEKLAKLGGRILCHGEAAYPAALAAIEAPPPVISVLGRADLLEHEAVAMVGARNASALGIKFARGLAQDLGQAGLVVVSGMARGIDAAAHAGALVSGTIAVIAGGVDVVYPPENGGLYELLRKQGAVISDMPLGVNPLPRHFPRRNRLISGLARGVVVVEAAERSGSLITANYALEQGREIFAVPGSPLDPRAKGGNRLLRDGATLTETANDVLGVLAPILGRAFAEPAPLVFEDGEERTSGLTDERLRHAVEERLGPEAVEIDELVRQCGASAADILTVLLEFELAGRAARHPGNRVARAAHD
jgi:DNA processing protein